MGWTLGLYFLRRYAAIAFWLFVGLYALISLIDFTELTNRRSGVPGFTMAMGLAISAARVPVIMQQTVPFIGLFAAIAMLVSLNRRYELVVARSAGISAWQFLWPACIGAFLFGALTIGVLNPLAAAGIAASQRMEAEMRASRSNTSAFDQPWLRQKTPGSDTIIGAHSVLDGGLELVGATFFSLDAGGAITERRDATRAFLRDGYWELRDVRLLRDGASTVEARAEDRVPTHLTPASVQERLAPPETVAFFDLPAKIRAARAFGLNANAFATHFHTLLSLPLLMVAMTLIAATVSMRFARMGQSSTMIMGGVFAGFLLYVVSVLVKAFGTSGFVPPVIVAWIPVAIAMFFGVTFLLYKEDG